MARVLIADPLEESAVAKIRDAGLEVVIRNKETDGSIEEQIKGFDCVVVRSATKVTKEVIAAADSLKLVVRAGVGLDNVDLDAAREKGVKVLNTPEAPTASVAEMVLALMFSLARRVAAADSSMKDERWDKKKLSGSELWQKTLGVVGFGRIGYEVAKRAIALDMKVLAHDVIDIEEICNDIGAERTDLEDLLKRSDYVSLHVPLVPQTRGMIGERELDLMKESAFLINTARGGVVDEKALLKALDENKIAGAGLDVFEEEPPVEWELVKHPKVVATPHLSSSTSEAQVRVGELTAEKVIGEFK
ncbi:MAG: D-2-hydroxyacid dehydrogenase [Candidatus Thorarchaeota archaeon SMTZ1-83]|nr:MAG: 3-phosphoglycerate dehydrogenase [Candidatus Thorarchaeota archaeon SMTZ1-83]